MLTDPIRAYALSCCMDADSCPACRAMDGEEWPREEDVTWIRGLDCTSEEGCRCQLMPIFADEGTVELG